jgi:hypothetical protein
MKKISLNTMTRITGGDRVGVVCLVAGFVATTSIIGIAMTYATVRSCLNA